MVAGSQHGRQLPEGAPLLQRGGNGACDVEAQYRRTFAAAGQRRRVPLWVWAAACIVVGLLALYLTGVSFRSRQPELPIVMCVVYDSVVFTN